MVLADTMDVFFVILGLMITFPCLWLLLSAVWPKMVAECTDRVTSGLWKSFFAGLPILVGSVITVAIVSKIPGGGGGAASIATICLSLIYACAGVSGLATQIGKRLPSPVDSDRPWKATIRGSVVLVFSWLLPLVGWFVILPFSLITGAGSVTRVFFTRMFGKKGSAAPVGASATNAADAAQTNAAAALNNAASALTSAAAALSYSAAPAEILQPESNAASTPAIPTSATSSSLATRPDDDRAREYPSNLQARFEV